MPPPQSKKCASGKSEKRGRNANKHGQSTSVRERLLKGPSSMNFVHRFNISVFPLMQITIDDSFLLFSNSLQTLLVNFAEFGCLICGKVMSLPLTTPCAHNFCKQCLLGSYPDQSFVRERTCEGGRTLRAQKIVKKCPSCPNDISDFLQNPQVMHPSKIQLK